MIGKKLCKAIFVSVSIIFVYSLIELLYLQGNKTAEYILISINPYIHEIKINGTWWPPLLWKNQLRSVFAEPSYFGIYAAFSLPFLWYKLTTNLNDKKKIVIYGIITIIMTFLLFLTKARTGFIIHLGELVVLLVICIYVHNKEIFKRFCVIVLCSVVAFFSSNYFISNYMNNNSKSKVVVTNMKRVNNKAIVQEKIIKNENNKIRKDMNKYIEDNALSLANPDKRSNRARYSVMEADFKIGLDHPLFGVGSGLRDAYIPDYFSEIAKNNGEVKRWLAFQKKLGIMRSGFPKLGEYTSRFAETGILGIGLFLLPPFILIISLLRRIKQSDLFLQYKYIMFLTVFAGIMASGIGDILTVTYCYWVLLGLGYAMCFGTKENKYNE